MTPTAPTRPTLARFAALTAAVFSAGAALAAPPTPNNDPPVAHYDVYIGSKKYSEAPDKAKADEVVGALKKVKKDATVRGPFYRAVPGSTDDPFKVPHGQITFDSEGTEGGPYHSRTPSVPTGTSGLTIGRGYDMKEKSKAQIKKDLMAAGLSEADAELYAGGAGLSGAAAKKYIADHKLVEITPQQQKALFAISYASAEADVKRICEKADVVKAYGATDWDKLNPAIKDLLVDLRYRGDYTGATRANIQALVAKNDVKGLAAVVADESKWPGVPKDRFDRRKNLMNAAAAALPPTPAK